MRTAIHLWGECKMCRATPACAPLSRPERSLGITLVAAPKKRTEESSQTVLGMKARFTAYPLPQCLFPFWPFACTSTSHTMWCFVQHHCNSAPSPRKPRKLIDAFVIDLGIIILSTGLLFWVKCRCCTRLLTITRVSNTLF